MISSVKMKMYIKPFYKKKLKELYVKNMLTKF